MSYYLELIRMWIAESQASAWKWMNHLDRQEWIMLLLVVTLFGFLCMRGYGSRSKY
ncbi:MAG: hypothetical protein ACC645_07750 [Pirellulales bacterium]